MKKLIEVHQVTDEVTNENLQIEEEIEFNNWKENLVWYAKVISILLWVVIWIYVLIWVSVKPTTIDDIRVENLRKATEINNSASWELLRLRKRYADVVKVYNDSEWCKSHNTQTGSASDCYIFNK